MTAADESLEWIRWIADWVQGIDMFYLQSLATCCALSWLLHRAWLTLWTPVPKLINILGVEVPDAPNVSLAGIKADTITIHWQRPGANRPVQKYLIQVNGVNIGDTPKHETAIVVTGLKPAHFYNVRVIAVGANNFQAGSAVVRLRTYGRDGRPILDKGRVPANFSFEEPHPGEDSSEDSHAGRGHSVGIEAAALPENLPLATKRDTGQRRNTVGRKHSPSSAAADQAAYAARKSKEPEASMQQLTDKFEAIRKETEDMTLQISKDAEEFKSQVLELTKERDEKKHALKEKEEASEKLRKDINIAESKNRAAQNRKSQKGKVLRDKEASKTKMVEDMTRWKKEIGDMKLERENWEQEKDDLEAERLSKAEELRVTVRQRQNSLNGLEEEIKVKGLQIKELEEERQHLPGAPDDDDSRARDAAQRQRDIEWDIKERNLNTQLNNQALHLRGLEAEFQRQQAVFAALSAHQSNNPLMYHGNSSGVDFDPTGSQGKGKPRSRRNRKSRTNTISSPVNGFPIVDSAFPSASAYNNLNSTTSPSFAQGPYFDLSNDTAMVPISELMSGMSDADVRALTAGAPLSPTATSLLPSNIFADDDPPSPRGSGMFGPKLYNQGPSGYENDPQSPSSSSRSASLMSSPRSSANNLAMYGVSGRDYAAENDRRSLNSPRGEFGVIGSPAGSEQPVTNKPLSSFANMFSFPRPRGKTLQDGPALGTLKQGQSQSFPRSMEEPESINVNRSRRISFSSSWNVMPSFLTRNSTGDGAEGNGPAPARNVGARRRRGFDIFNNKSMDDPTYAERNPSSPRPLSIASSDLPRPSTDSAPFGWPAAAEGLFNRNSPLATNWSINAPQTWSRNPSRRPSIQHGSTTALTTGIATEDDEFLPPDLTTHTSPPAAGVIGTRPVSSHMQITPKLNPAAPAFTKGMFNFSSKADKEKAKGKGKERDASGSSDEPARPTTSPSVSRMSRDTHSIHTQSSLPESHESLNLERTSSNTPSEMTTPSAASTKDKESSFRQLLRKGSSSKFSFSSIRGKDSSLFGVKKAPGSASNSDRNAAGERDSSFDEYSEDISLGRSAESVTSSPMIGSLGSSEWKFKDSGPSTPKEGRMSGWSRLKFGKSKGRESSEVDRSEAETTGTEDEGND